MQLAVEDGGAGGVCAANLLSAEFTQLSKSPSGVVSLSFCVSRQQPGSERTAAKGLPKSPPTTTTTMV